MPETTSKRGRPSTGGPKVAYQIRLENDEAEALERMVAESHAVAVNVGGSASAASVLRKIVRKALVDQGFLKESAPQRKGGK